MSYRTSEKDKEALIEEYSTYLGHDIDISFLHTLAEEVETYGWIGDWLHWSDLGYTIYRRNWISGSTLRTFTSLMDAYFEKVPRGEELIVGEFLFERKKDGKGVPHFRISYYEQHWDIFRNQDN